MSEALPPIVDSHIHWWDPANPWMVMATQEQADGLGMGDISGMLRSYRPAEYRAEVAGHEVTKVVWVMANLAPAHLEEVRWVQEIAGDDPLFAGMIGSVSPGLPAAERAAGLDEQARFDKFRGVRVVGEFDMTGAAADDYMRELAERGLVFDHMGSHESTADAARLAERHPEVTWVLEHCGWPQHPDDPADVAAWREGVARMAAVGNVNCKLSGLGMTVHAQTLDAQRPFLEHCLDQFGVDRCLFGSNFPVDGLYGTYGEVVDLFDQFTSALSDDDRRKLFAANAERIYRI
jgi:L-fuconolactonase